MYGSYFHYVEYMWNLAKDNSNILVLMFEDIIKVLFWHKFHFIEFTCTQHYKVFAIRTYLRPISSILYPLSYYRIKVQYTLI